MDGPRARFEEAGKSHKDPANQIGRRSTPSLQDIDEDIFSNKET